MDNIIQNDIKKLFIIGAGASADAGIATSRNLFREVILEAIKNDDGFGLERKADLIIERLKKFYPNFKFSINDTWPDFEKYFDMVYNFNKAKDFISLDFNKDKELKGLVEGIDNDAMELLYWYLFTACWNWAGQRSNNYLKMFINKELNRIDDEIAVISLNYEWLFERIWLLSSKKVDEKFWGDRVEHANMPQIYNPQFEFPLFKPHGSANLIIVNKNDEIEITMPYGFSVNNNENRTSKLKINEFFEDWKVIDKEDDYKLCYCAVPIDSENSNFKTKLKDLIPGFIPPIGIKGAIGPDVLIKLLGEKTPKYNLLCKYIKNQLERSVQSIYGVKEEIWLVGTNLMIDPYLFDHVRLKKIINPSIKIKFISPEELDANKLVKELKEIEFYNGTLASYSDLIERKEEPKFKKITC